MTGLEALNKFVNIFAEYCVKTQHQEMNATNMQTAVEYLARSEECRTIEKSLNALEIIKEKCVNVYWFKSELTLRNISYRYYVNNFGSFHNGLVVKLLDEEEFDLLKECLE